MFLFGWKYLQWRRCWKTRQQCWSLCKSDTSWSMLCLYLGKTGSK